MPSDSQQENNSRPPGAPTPPGAELQDDSKPVTTPGSKRVMLRAERHDEIEITEVDNGMRRVPETFTVVRRDGTYHGPVLLLSAEVDGEEQNWQLTAPGPNSQLILWQAVTGKNDKWRSSWVPVAEVRARIADVEQYNICDHCGEPKRDLWHERLALFELCGKDDVEVDS